MPLEESDIKKLLKCEICNSNYDLNEQPRLTPCFKTICKKCICKIEHYLEVNDSSYFKCLDPKCPDEHFYPKKGLPINKIVSQIINELKSKRSTQVKELEETLNQMDLLVQQLTHDINNTNLKINQHCMQLRKKVKQSADDLIQKIHDLEKVFFKNIDDYERECMQNNAKNRELKPALEDLISKASFFLANNRLDLERIDFNENDIENSKDCALIYNKKLEEQIQNVESLVFNYKLLEYEPRVFSNILIGSLDFKSLPVVTNDIIISGSSDHTIKVWNIRTSSLINTLTGHSKDINCIFVISNELLVSGSSDNTIKCWNLKTGDCLNTLIGHTKCVNCIQVILNDIIVSGADDSTLRTWSIKSSQCVHTLQGHSDYILCLQVLTTELTASGSADNLIKIWNIKTGKCINTLYGHSGHVNCLDLTTNHLLISGSNDHTIRVWNPKNISCLFVLQGHWKEIKCIKSINFDWIISGSSDHTVRIWNLKNGKCVNTLKEHTEDVTCLQLVSNEIVISASVDNKIKIWNINTGKCMRTLEGHKSWVRTLLVVSTDKLVSGSEDKTIKVWNFKTGQLLTTLEGHTNSVWCIQPLSNISIA